MVGLIAPAVGVGPDCQACWANGVSGFCAADALYLSFRREERRKWIDGALLLLGIHTYHE